VGGGRGGVYCVDLERLGWRVAVSSFWGSPAHTLASNTNTTAPNRTPLRPHRQLADFGLTKILRDTDHVVNHNGAGTITHLAPGERTASLTPPPAARPAGCRHGRALAALPRLCCSTLLSRPLATPSRH